MDWTTLLANVATLINDGAPVAETLEPSWAPAIALAAKLLSGAAQAEPTAVSLVQSIQNGQTPTAAQLASYFAAYDTAYAQLQVDIAAQLAKLPAA